MLIDFAQQYVQALASADAERIARSLHDVFADDAGDRAALRLTRRWSRDGIRRSAIETRYLRLAGGWQVARSPRSSPGRTGDRRPPLQRVWSWGDRRAGWRRAWVCGRPPFGVVRLCHRGNAVAAAGGVLAAAQTCANSRRRTDSRPNQRVGGNHPEERLGQGSGTGPPDAATVQSRGSDQWLSKEPASSYPGWKRSISSACASMARGALPGKQVPPRHCGRLAWQGPCRSAPA